MTIRQNRQNSSVKIMQPLVRLRKCEDDILYEKLSDFIYSLSDSVKLLLNFEKLVKRCL